MKPERGYFSTVLEQMRPLITGSIVVSVAIPLILVLSKAPAIAYLECYGTLLVCAFAIGQYRAWSRERKEKVEILASIPKPDFWIRKYHIQPTGDTGGGRSVWIQLEIEQTRGALIEQCQGHLLKIWHKWPAGSGIGNGEWEESDIEPQALDWSMDGSAPVTLIPGQRLNICWIHVNRPDWIQMCVNPVPLRSFDQLTREGSFRFDVLIRAKQCEDVYASVEVARGDPSWDLPKVQLGQTTNGQTGQTGTA